MAEDANTSSQSATINTSQPTVMNTSPAGKPCETVVVKHPTDDKRTMTINKSDYDEGVHGKVAIPKRAKTSKKDAAETDGGDG